MTQAWRTEDLGWRPGPGIPTPTKEGLWMENYHIDLEVRPTTQQPLLSEEEPTTLEDTLGPTTLLFLTGKGKRGLQPWAGTHIREGGTRRGIPVMKLETKDMVRKMTPGGETATRRVETADPRGSMRISSSGAPPARSLPSSHSR